MAQSKKYALLEAIVNTGLGIIIGWTTSFCILHFVFGLPVSPMQNSLITIILTFVSIGRSYLVRRLFVILHLKRKYGKKFKLSKVK